MRGRAVAKKQKILREAQPGGVFGRRIRSAVAGSGVAPGQSSDSGQSLGQTGGWKAGTCVVITLSAAKQRQEMLCSN
jgi:hypothetical protein